MNTNTKRNIAIYHLTQLFGNLDFTLPIYVLFGKNYVGLSYSQISLLVVVLFAGSVGFDFLLGIFADSFSRKRSYIWGIFLSLLGLLPFILTKDYSLFIFGVFLSGVGSALSSNVLDTYVYENLNDHRLTEHYAGITSKAQQMFYYGRTIAGVLGGFFFAVNPILPYVFYATALIFCILLAIFYLKEVSIKQEKKNIMQTTTAAFSFLKERKDILYFCLIGLLILAFSDLLFGYYQPYFNTLHISPLMIGILYSVISIVSSFGSGLMKKWLSTYSAKAINNFMIVATIITACFMIPQLFPLAFVGSLFVALTFGFVAPNLRHFLNIQSPSDIKTSIASFGTTMYAVGTMIGLFLSGILADHFSSTVILTIIIGGSFVCLLLNSLQKPLSLDRKNFSQ